MASFFESAVQKTKDMTDIARINSLISDEEKKINGVYTQLGKFYATLHANDYESQFAGMMIAIKEAEMNISLYKKQILDIKGVTICEKCGSEVAKSVLFCNVCGSQMPKTEFNDFSNSTRCSSCGVMVPKDVRFCTNCGKPMAQAMPVVPAPSVAPAVPVAPATPVEVESPVIESIFCPNCGTKLDGDTVFCTECGTKIE
jgi:predicted amidophosphoribosyltransferase